MQKWLQTYFFSSIPYRKISGRIKKTYITSQKIPLHTIAEIFFSEIRKIHILEKASAMAFSFVLSIFPAIVFIFTLVPYMPVNDMQGKVMFALKSLLPVSIYKGAAAAIYDIIHIPHGGLLSFGFAFAAFTAMNGIISMIAAFNRCYHTAETRGYTRRILVSIVILFLLLTIAFIAILAALYTKHLIDGFHLDEEFLIYFFTFLKQLFFFVVFYVAISLIYYIAPAIHIRWRFFSPGSLIASLLILVFTSGFSFYVNNFDSYNKLYGSIGAFIGVMLWFYAVSLVLLIGFEINVSLDKARRGVFNGENGTSKGNQRF
jgi:membrane protein